MLKANFYKSFYENYNDGVSIIDKGEVVDCNSKLLELFKYKNNELNRNDLVDFTFFET